MNETYYEPQKKRRWSNWVMDNAVEIIFVAGIIIAYKLGRVNGYTDCLMDMKRITTRR